MKQIIFFIAFLFSSFAAMGADANGYTASYECKAGSANCNVDVATLVAAACQQTITAAASWSTINWSNTVICLEAGDHTAKGTLTTGSSGSSGTRKILRYYRSGDNDDDPWNQADGNKAKISQLVVSGDYWIVQRITLPTNTTNGIVRLAVTGGNVILNRILLEGPGGTTACQDGVEFNGGDGNTLQNSVVRDLRSCTAGSPVGMQLSAGSNLKVVNNEIYNWCEHPLQIGYDSIPSLPGAIIENNDIYATSAIYNGSGDAAMSASISIKTHATTTNQVKIIHNRIWGGRKQSSACGDSGDSSAISSNASVSQANEYVLIQNNILMDGVGGVAAYNNTMQFHSIIGNIFYDISNKGTELYSKAISFNSYSKVEAYLNHFIYTHTATSNTDNGVLSEWLGVTNNDIRCNVFSDSNRAATDATAASTIADYNTFYGTTLFTFNGTATNINKSITLKTTYTGCTTAGCTATENTTGLSIGDVVRTSSTPTTDCISNTKHCYLYKVTSVGASGAIQAVRGPYSFYRKLRTGATQFFIPYVRPYSGAAEATLCPSGFASRSGIGVDNTQP